MLDFDVKVLIADDMPTIRDLVKGQLRALGYKYIVEAMDGEQAMSLLLQHEATVSPVRMVISDWNMPRVNGLEFLKQVRAMKQWTNLPFVLLTSESEKEQVTEAILAGVSQYIVKPFAGKAFEDKIKQAWDKHHKPKKA